MIAGTPLAREVVKLERDGWDDSAARNVDRPGEDVMAGAFAIERDHAGLVSC